MGEVAKVIPIADGFSEWAKLRTMREWRNHAEAWQAYGEKMENLYELAQIRADMSEALLADALKELERVRGLL